MHNSRLSFRVVNLQSIEDNIVNSDVFSVVNVCKCVLFFEKFLVGKVNVTLELMHNTEIIEN